jgi:hypothetical protein
MNVPEIFQRPDDDDALDLSNITTVSVCKQVAGSWTSIPMKYDIEQIDTTEKLYALLGPGLFDIIGRDDRTRRIVRRQKVQLPGIPWKNWNEPDEERAAAAPVFHAQPMQQQSGGTDATLLVAMIQLMGQQMQSTSQMMMTVMQMQGTNSDKHTQSMAQMFTAFGAAQSSLLEKVMARGEGSDPQNAFLRGVETAAEIQRGAREASEPEQTSGEGIGEILDAVSKGVETFAKVKGLANTGEA